MRAARARDNYILTTGTGSGKSLAFIVPIVDHVLRNGSGRGIQAIIVYPMNVLANSQMGELEKFLCRGYPEGRQPVTFRRYTGQEKDAERREILANPPDILLTNYVMPELVLTTSLAYRSSRISVEGAASEMQTNSFRVLDSSPSANVIRIPVCSLLPLGPFHAFCRIDGKRRDLYLKECARLSRPPDRPLIRSFAYSTQRSFVLFASWSNAFIRSVGQCMSIRMR